MKLKDLRLGQKFYFSVLDGFGHAMKIDLQTIFGARINILSISSGYVLGFIDPETEVELDTE